VPTITPTITPNSKRTRTALDNQKTQAAENTAQAQDS
jgi:hypothetical protein